MVDTKRKFNFNEIFSNFQNYETIKNGIKEEIKNNFAIRKEMVEVTVTSKTIDMPLGELLVNLFLMRAFAEFNIHVIPEDLFVERYMTQDAMENYFNHIIVRCRMNNIDYDDIRQVIADTMNEMSDVSGVYNILRGNSISFRDFVRLEVEEDDAKSIFNPEVKSGSFSDIESQFNSYGDKIFEFFRNRKDTELHPFIISNTGINKKQAIQCFSFVGLKPDIDGSIIPVVVKDNFIHGLSGLENYFINCKGTRKALITNNKMTRRSGYLTRKLSLSNINRFHDNNILDCNGPHFVDFNIQNQRKMNMVLGRQYYELDDQGNKVSDVLYTVEKDSNLVGKHIGLRSPVTCGCGKCVCSTCYGRDLSEINKNINTGLNAVLKITEPLTQMLLSAKHLLTTKTEKIKWADEFNEIFTINMDSIYFASDVDATVSFKKPTEEEYDEDEESYYTTKINLTINGAKKSFEFDSPVQLFINKKFTSQDKMKSDTEEIVINSKSVDEDTAIFTYPVKNAELTKSLQEILDLVESSSHLGIDNYNDLVNKFDDLLISNNLDYINSVHAEMIISNLIRDERTDKKLDFSKEKLDSYYIARVTKSIMDAPLAISLSFERLNDQLIDLKTYEKNEVSMMDALFR